MTTFAIIQARMGSARLPGKVLRELGGRPLLEWIVRAAGRIFGVDRVVVATSEASADDAIEDWCRKQKISCRRGSENDVLARFIAVTRAEGAGDGDVIVRLLADCPFFDPAVGGQVLTLLHTSGAHYTSNTVPPTWPDGLDCEAVRFEVLLEASRLAKKSSEREHVTPFVYSQQHRYKVAPLICPIEGLASERWTVDDARDFAFTEAIVAELGEPSSFIQIMNLLARKPELRKINALAKRNEGYDKSLRVDAQRSIYGFAESQRLKTAAEKFIPLGSQTFSKAHIQYPDNASPLFLTHGRGGRVWDVDGNEYVDLVCGLLAVMLGYCDPDVDVAVRDQLTRGSSFSLATELEFQLAELICEMVPCAEQVRFGKNGSDATLGCVRIARAYTKRERIAVCGYHGWHDWYIGATVRNLGVTKGAAETTHVLPALDPEALDKLLASHPSEFAAVFIEPINVVRHTNETIAAVRDIAHNHGALLIFDEIITGFRVASGGAQELYGVVPDLAAFGKGIGNGLPISAVVGAAHLMKTVEDIFLSSTFGGEALSLAASIAVLEKIKREPVLQTIAATGSAMAESAEELIKKHGISDVIQLKGHPAWKILAIMDHPTARKEAIKTLFLREMLARGILINASHNVCYAHSADDIARVLVAYDEALAVVADELATGSLEARLGIDPIEPIFRVR